MLRGEAMQTQEIRGGEGRIVSTPLTVQYPRQAANPPSKARSKPRKVRETSAAEAKATANTPWGMWTATKGTKKDAVVSQRITTTLTVILEESMRDMLGRDIRQRVQSDFGRKAWMQSDRSSNAWVTTCPKEHNGLNARPFPVVVHAYFGVGQHCLTGLVGQYIRQKTCKGKKDWETECDAYG